MLTIDAYNNWAKTYDTDNNKTRDLEAKAIRTVLGEIIVDNIIEIGCGTGKNTQWLASKCRQLTAVDFSREMLELAKEKIKETNVQFKQADIAVAWNIKEASLITCSLVLEHIKNISLVFEQAAMHLHQDGLLYICELHPYKQLQGSRARFEQDGNLMHLEYFIHHISDFFESAWKNNLICEDLQEWFDTEDRGQTPRLVSCLFRKK
ncbi:MAG: class I SAM-dependent methyltransferase [Chitinophagaceae bacterium]